MTTKHTGNALFGSAHSELLAERDRLREVNAELVRALKLLNKPEWTTNAVARDVIRAALAAAREAV